MVHSQSATPSLDEDHQYLAAETLRPTPMRHNREANDQFALSTHLYFLKMRKKHDSERSSIIFVAAVKTAVFLNRDRHKLIEERQFVSMVFVRILLVVN